MPIEIRELIIKTTVNEDQTVGTKKERDIAGKEEIIAECIDQVMCILKQEKER